ncbi:hypothetical protein [Elizabethkingia anophelis]
MNLVNLNEKELRDTNGGGLLVLILALAIYNGYKDTEAANKRV